EWRRDVLARPPRQTSRRPGAEWRDAVAHLPREPKDCAGSDAGRATRSGAGRCARPDASRDARRRRPARPHRDRARGGAVVALDARQIASTPYKNITALQDL